MPKNERYDRGKNRQGTEKSYGFTHELRHRQPHHASNEEYNAKIAAENEYENPKRHNCRKKWLAGKTQEHKVQA